MQKIVSWISIIILAIIIIFAFTRKDNIPILDESTINQPGNDVAEIFVENDSEDNQTLIKYNGTAFNPKTIEVIVGSTVTFISEDSGQMWVASNNHPTHTLYPGSNIDKCNDEELRSTIFDQCESGNSFSFTFNEVGSWDYHDHLNPRANGTISVIE